MKYRNLFVSLTLSVLLFGNNLSMAIETKATSAPEAAIKDDAKAKSTHSEVAAKHKQPAKIKLVDINTAKKDELMKLPGIGAVEADKIIAGRPFGGKEHLALEKIITVETYEAIKKKIICRMTKKDIDTVLARSAQKNKK